MSLVMSKTKNSCQIFIDLEGVLCFWEKFLSIIYTPYFGRESIELFLRVSTSQFLNDESGMSFAVLAENDFEDIVNWIKRS